MAATSLREQLQKLAAPQTSIFKDNKKRVSLLFDPKEAALKDRDTFYEIGISGLKELIALFEGFCVYEDSLFSLTSKDFERAIQTKEVNRNLDQTIEKFLLQLSPYFLLQSSHKALEWLVNRYHIHEYNQDAIMALILPYHDTKIFVRFVQILQIKSTQWKWLEPVQTHGIALSKLTLYQQCVSNTSTLQFIAKTTMKYVIQFGDRATHLNTVFAFFCSSTIGTMNNVHNVSEAIISSLLPTLMEALESQVADFRSCAYVIFGFLMTKGKLKRKTINEIVDKLLASEFEINPDVVLLINLIYANQKHMRKMSEFVLNNISSDTMQTICKYLKIFSAKKINCQPFILAFLSGILPLLNGGTEEFMKFTPLLNILMDEVDFNDIAPEKAIECVLNEACSLQKNEKPSDDGSDIEIIEDDNDVSQKLINWYSNFLKNFETKYPNAFDAVVKKEMRSDNKISAERKASLAKVLGFNPALAHQFGGAYLFENLNHINPEIRIEAVNYITKELYALQIKNKDFVKDSIINRLNDDDPGVVMAVLSIENKSLNEILSDTDITDAFCNIVSKSSKKWKPVIKTAIMKFCVLDNLPVNHDTVMAIIPHLFPYSPESSLNTWQILTSSWGKKFGLKDKISCKESFADNPQILRQIIFKALFVDHVMSFDDVIDVTRLKKDNTLELCFYLLLKTCSIDTAKAEDILDILDLLLDSVHTRTIISSEIGTSFTNETIMEFIKCAKHDKILFEVLAYIFVRITDTLDVNDVSKPWCNVCENAKNILTRRLFELYITGCGIPGYSEEYTQLLQKLFQQLFRSPKEKFDYIANIAFGHILYATDAKDLISPALQLRCLKLLNNFITVQKNETWLYESDVLISVVIFGLNHPISYIREAVFQLIEVVVGKAKGNFIYVELLKELVNHKEQMLLDHEQISQVLRKILTQQSIGSKIFKKNCLIKLTGILINDTPAYVKSALVKLFSDINANIYSHIVPCLKSLITSLKINKSNTKISFNIYESNLFNNVINLLNEQTVSAISKDEVWQIIEECLKEYKECILEESMTLTSPCVLVFKQLNEDVFGKVPENRCSELINLITLAGAISNNPSIASIASKTIKKMHIKLDDFKPILQKMLNVVDPADNANKKKKSTVSMLSHQIVETEEWRLGVTLLEYVQNKKKMSLDNNFVSMLFQLLKKCLRFEEQSYVEYTKQLILSSIWYYLKKYVVNEDEDQLKAVKSMFDVELVVQCIRGTQNPQTHHHALIVLSHAAYILPEQVLHHTMEIFTFIGSSVLRHDDAYSFQIITKIIETLVPILVMMDKSIEDYGEDELRQLQKRVVPVLRIFADVVLHVPEHRRLPLYKKLVETLGKDHFLWVFITILFETHISHFNDEKKKDKQPARTLADKESPINRIDFAQSILMEFTPETALDNFIKMIKYLKSLPEQKDEDATDTYVDPSAIFSIKCHSAIQLRHFKYVIVTFLNNCLASAAFVERCHQITDTSMENHYKELIINVLTFIQSISKIKDEKTAKYWRVMLHHSYDLLDHANNLLSAPMFLSVIRGLLKHTLHTVQRKAMELLNTKIQCSPEMFDNVDKELLFSLLPTLLSIVQSIENTSNNTNENENQDLELNQQTALLSLKLLTRLLASQNPEPFKPVLEVVTDYTCNTSIPPNVMASVVLCLAELCGNLKVHALSALRRFMPALIKVLKRQREAETPELVLLSTVTAISKIIESLPLFLSPYLQKIIYEYSILCAKWQSQDQDCNKVSAIVSKLVTIKKKLANSIPPRVLIPVANETHQMILSKQKYDVVGPVMSVLADSFTNITTADFTTLQQDLTSFFISALQLRCDAGEQNVDAGTIDKAEDEVVNALVSLVLKLSETSFRPFYFKIYDWAIRTNIEGYKDRAITFYRVSSAIADKLKGLFVLFAGHFVKNAADLLDACNNSKSEHLYFDSEEKCIMLIKYIIKTLHIVFLYDSQNFLDKNRFETLMQPIVDQLENTLGGISSLKERATEVIVPCISQFAVATGDDSLWKLLNYQVLLKTRHNDAELRLTALDCFVAMASQLGSNWLPLLAESVPFLAELLEDGDQRIETATKNAIRTLEQILGEPLEKYF